MANPTNFTALTPAKLGNPTSPLVRVATPMTKTATTLVATSPGFIDEDGAVLATPFLISVQLTSGTNKNYVEVMEVTAVAADKVTATVVRGISDTRDYTASNSDFAVAIPKDQVIEIAYTEQMQNMVNDALLGNIGSAKKFNATPTWDTNAGVAQSCPEYADIATGEAAITSPQNGNKFYATAEGVERIYIGGAWTSAASGTTVNATETAAGKVELATLAEQGAQTETGGTGASLVLQAKNTVKTPSTYTPAYLTGGGSAQSNFVLWAVVSDASFRITIDGTAYNVDGISFVGNISMDEIAATIQTAIQTATSGTETCIWDTDHFVITSANTTSSSAITVLTTSTGTVGTDISGAGASDWMDCDSGNGTVTAAVLDQTQDENKVPVLDQSGKIDNQFMPAQGSVLNSDFSAKGDLLVGTGSGTKTALSVGTNGQIPVADSSEASGIKWETKNYLSNFGVFTARGQGVFLAQNDGLIFAQATVNTNQYGNLTIQSDANSSPTTVLAVGYSYGLTGPIATITVPFRKGDYVSISGNNINVLTCYSIYFS